MKRTRAIVRWVPASQGGRKRLPDGPVYWAVAKFDDATSEKSECAWSLEVEFLKPVGKRVLLARVRFVSSAAPANLLAKGSRFRFCEGRHVVARGIVLPERLKVPAQLNPLTLAVLG